MSSIVERDERASIVLDDFDDRCDEAWEALERRASSDPVAHLLTVMYERRGVHVSHAAERIATRIGAYEPEAYIDSDDLRSSVGRTFDALLLAVGEQRRLRDTELVAYRELGRRRAEQGITLEQVLSAFRVGYQALWKILSKKAKEMGPGYSRGLLEQADRIWETFEQVTGAVTDSHAEATATVNVEQRRCALRFLEGLRGYPVDAAETREQAAALGLDPDGWFTVAVQQSGGRPRLAGSDLVTIEEPDLLVVVAGWEGEPSRTEARLAERLQHQRYRHIGIGIARQGLAGARQSLRDAEWAHAAAVACGAPRVTFRDGWLDCLAVGHQEYLDVLVAPAVQAIEDSDELRMTLETFLRMDGNLTAAGKALYVHPNTISYRLRQFEGRTGVDARTSGGKALVRVALTFSGMRQPPAGEPVAGHSAAL